MTRRQFNNIRLMIRALAAGLIFGGLIKLVMQFPNMP